MATGTTGTASAPVFHGDDHEQANEYSSLSVLAIIALVIGIAAPLAIAAPFLLAVPLFGIAVSLVALRRIAVSGGTLAGRGAATLGLVLCVASAVLPVSRDLFQRAIRVNQAETFGKTWVSLVTSGSLKQAFRMTVDSTRPVAPNPPGEPGKPPAPGDPSPAPKVNPYETFVADPVIKALEAAGAKADVSVRDTLDFQVATYRNVTVRQLYRVIPEPSSASAQPFEFILSVQRGVIPRESMSRWLVMAYIIPKTDADSALKR